ncbi:SAM domain (Sterile alpha motif) [uncultured Defluviicoccus sp.]|uniref:SAM domain (Sterile alpha motif) n=1 Tax=metagenome TaxID=256318 RepID=A0A380TCD3_9ZZZZ|nr:SAM domain (Sterile alpha motif) [uncultured Defluviicoccus sp.]
MDIAAWLQRLGLEQYEQTFRDNAIDAEVLPELTDADLQQLGVLLGHRKRLFKAIVELGPSSTSQPDASTDEIAAKNRVAEGVAERRQLTVMFIDLVGSTALASRLDPEDMREIVRAYQRCVADSVARYVGFVAQYMGDGVLVYFGYPKAREDAAEQGVRAGLALVDAVARLQESEPLKVRIGIATGQVVVGDLIPSGEGQEHAVVGETPNLAARLQTLAEPDAVLIAQQTRQLVGDLFDYRDLGTVEMKGFPEPIHAYQVIGESSIESRFEALHGATPTPLVGRDEEVGLLQRYWQCAKSGEGRVVLLSGEPGIGKSRLTVALQERIANEPLARLRYFCSPHHQDSAFHPTIAQLGRAAGFERDDTSEKKLDKLMALLATTSLENGALLAELLSLPTEGRFPPVQLTPHRKKEKTFEALFRHLEGLARQGPVLMLFEDVHWIDPSSRELLDLVIERVPSLPVLLLVTFRPEFQPPWTGLAHVANLVLHRLGRREGAALVQRVVGNGDLPSDVVTEIIERTDGVPLFVEELTKAVLEGGNARTVLSNAAALTVPATLHASLMARLDRLGSVAREVAQVGALLGREFSYELLAAVTRRKEAELNAALDQLVVAGLVFRQGAPPQATYLFKHALVQDAAYGTLLRGKRQELHRRVADLLEEKWSEIAEAQPELLAHHFVQAGLVEQAIDYYTRAGQRALARSAMAEATAQLKKGLELLTSLPDSASRQRRELELQIGLGRVLIGTRGFAAAEVGETYARARALCKQLSRPPQIVPVLYGQWVHHLLKGPLRVARELAADMLQLGEDTSNAAVTGVGHRLTGATCFQLGEFLASRAHLEEALAEYDPADRPFYMSLFPQDARVALLFYLSYDLFCLGHLNQARLRSEEAVDEARKLGHAFSLAQALNLSCTLDWPTRSSEELQARVDTLIAVSEEHGFPYFRARGTIWRGWALAESGQAAEGIAVLRAGVVEYQATGAVQYVPFFLTLLADAEGKAQQLEGGLGHLEEAERLVSETGDRWAEAELHRVRGELLRSNDDDTAAEHCFHDAIGIAQKQSAKLWELRAATSLARLWCDRGKRDAARNLLGPIYGWFTDGFDTSVLKEAEALLTEL